jgi:hypothetical protein
MSFSPLQNVTSTRVAASEVKFNVVFLALTQIGKFSWEIKIWLKEIEATVINNGIMNKNCIVYRVK